MNQKQKLQNLLGESSGQVIPKDLPTVGQLRVPDVAGGPRNNFVEDTRAVGSQWTDLAKSLGRFGTEGMQNFAQGYTQEAENQVLEYKKLTPEQKRAHLENKEELNKYYRKLGVFGLNPIARNAIEKQQGAAYLAEAKESYNSLLSDISLYAQGQPIQDDTHLDYIQSLGIAKGEGVMDADTIRGINEHFNQKFISEKGDVLSTTARQAGLIQGLTGVQEKVIEDYPAQFDDIVKATAVGMFGEGVKQAVEGDPNNIPEVFEENLQPMFDLSATWNVNEADKAITSMKEQFYSEVNGEVVYNAELHKKALKGLVGRMQYGNRKLNHQDIIAHLGQIEIDAEAQYSKNDRERTRLVQENLAPINNEFDQAADVFTKNGDIIGLDNLIDQYKEKIREAFPDNPLALADALREFETQIGIEERDLDRVLTQEDRNNRAQDALEAKQERQNLKETQLISNSQTTARPQTLTNVTGLMRGKNFIAEASKNNLNVSTYYNEVASSTIGGQPSYYPTPAGIALEAKVMGSASAAQNDFIRKYLDDNAYGVTKEEAATAWINEGYPQWQSTQFNEIAFGAITEQRDAEFDGDKKLQALTRTLVDPKDREAVHEAYRTLSSEAAYEEANNRSIEQTVQQSTDSNYTITRSTIQPDKVSISTPYKSFSEYDDKRDIADTTFSAYQSALISGVRPDNASALAHIHLSRNAHISGKGGEKFSEDLANFNLGTDTVEELEVLQTRIEGFLENYGVPIGMVTGEDFTDHEGVTHASLSFTPSILQALHAGNIFATTSFGKDGIVDTLTDMTGEWLRPLAVEMHNNPDVPRAQGKSITEIHADLIGHHEERMSEMGIDFNYDENSEELTQLRNFVDEESVSPEAVKEAQEGIGFLDTLNIEVGYDKHDPKGFLNDVSGFAMNSVTNTVNMLSHAIMTGQTLKTSTYGPAGMNVMEQTLYGQTPDEQEIIQSIKAKQRAGFNTFTPFADLVEDEDYFQNPTLISQRVYSFIPDMAAVAITGGTSTTATVGKKVLLEAAETAAEKGAKQAAKRTIDDTATGLGRAAMWSKNFALNRLDARFATEFAFAVGGATGEQLAEKYELGGFGTFVAMIAGGVSAAKLSKGSVWKTAKLNAKITGKSPNQIFHMIQSGKLTEQEVGKLLTLGRLMKHGDLNIEKLQFDELKALTKKFDIDVDKELGIPFDELLETDVPQLRKLITESAKGNPRARKRFIEQSLFGSERGLAFPNETIRSIGEQLGITRRNKLGQMLSEKAYRQKVQRAFEDAPQSRQEKIFKIFDDEVIELNRLEDIRNITIRESQALQASLHGSKRVTALPLAAYEMIGKALKKEGIDVNLNLRHENGRIKKRAELAEQLEKHYDSLKTAEERNAFARRIQDFQKKYNEKYGIGEGDRPINLGGESGGGKPKPDGDGGGNPPTGGRNADDEGRPDPEPESDTPPDPEPDTPPPPPEPDTPPPNSGSSSSNSGNSGQNFNPNDNNSGRSSQARITGNSVANQSEGGNNLFVEAADKPNEKGKPPNRDPNYDTKKNKDPNVRFDTNKETYVPQELSVGNIDKTKDMRYTTEGFPRSTWEGISSGRVTAITYNKGFQPDGLFIERISKGKKGEVVEMFEKIDKKKTGNKIYVEITGVAKTPKGKGLSGRQVDTYSKESGLSPQWYQERTSDQFPTAHVRFKLVRGNFADRDQAQAFVDKAGKKTSALDDNLDFTKSPFTAKDLESPHTRTLATNFQMLNKIVGEPFFRGKKPSGVMARAYKYFESNANVGAYEAGDRVGIFFKNVSHNSAAEIDKVFDARVSTIITEAPNRAGYLAKNDKVKHAKLLRMLEERGYKHQGNGVYMHSDAVITDPNVKVRKASDIGPDEQSKTNPRAIAEGRDNPQGKPTASPDVPATSSKVSYVNGTKAVAKAEADGKGVSVLRKEGEKHFGNPFSHLKTQTRNTIKTKNLEESVNNYRAWLEGTDFTDIKQERRQWVLDQIDSRSLDGKELLYYRKPKAGETNHAEVLAEFIEKRSKKNQGRYKNPESAGKQVTEAGETVDFPMTPENQARLDMIAETMKDKPKVRKDPRPPTNPTSDKQAQQDIYRDAKREKGDATTTLVAGERNTSRNQELEYDPNNLGIPAIETGQIIPAKKPRFKKVKGVSEEMTTILNNMTDKHYREVSERIIREADHYDEIRADQMSKAAIKKWLNSPPILKRIALEAEDQGVSPF
nr:metalloproteinase [uncultured Mediterranean phage uvMED]